jgi:hypothetical protein
MRTSDSFSECQAAGEIRREVPINAPLQAAIHQFDIDCKAGSNFTDRASRRADSG